jgi:predicted nucleic acid-binding protein
MNAVDTNVLLYSVDRDEPAKQLKAQQLLRQLHSANEPTLLLW